MFCSSCQIQILGSGMIDTVEHMCYNTMGVRDEPEEKRGGTAMEPTFVERGAFVLAGVVAHGRPQEMDFGQVWEQGHMPLNEQVSLLSVDQAYYGAWMGAPDGIPDYIAGMAVTADAPLPPAPPDAKSPRRAMRCSTAWSGPSARPMGTSITSGFSLALTSLTRARPISSIILPVARAMSPPRRSISRYGARVSRPHSIFRREL